jgi:hypothetical protein
VLNFYELRSFIHVKTIPVMDELEGVVILNEEHSRKILDPRGSGGNAAGAERERDRKDKSKRKSTVPDAPPSLSTSHVLITAGSKGLLHVYNIIVKVSWEIIKYSLVAVFTD